MFDRVERSLIIGRAIQASQQLRSKKMTWEQVVAEWDKAAQQGR